MSQPSLSHKPGGEGCTVTLADGTVLVKEGHVLAGLREVAAYCDAHGVGIACVSTPTTIYGDLTVQRRRQPGNWHGSGVMFPEYDSLGKIGRCELLPTFMRP